MTRTVRPHAAAALLLGYTAYRAWTLSFTYDESWTIHYVRAPWTDVVAGVVPAVQRISAY